MNRTFTYDYYRHCYGVAVWQEIKAYRARLTPPTSGNARVIASWPTSHKRPVSVVSYRAAPSYRVW